MKLIDNLVEGTECNNKITAVFVHEHTKEDPVRPVKIRTLVTEFRQPIQVQSHLEMPGILVQLGCIQCT